MYKFQKILKAIIAKINYNKKKNN